MWFQVPVYPHLEVTKAGQIRSSKSDRELKGTIRPDGYIQIAVARGKFKLLQVLILETFVGPRPVGMMALHRDDIRSNNALSNLYWGTSKANSEDRVRNHRNTGRLVAAAKHSEEKVLAICADLDAGLPVSEIARRHSVTQPTVSAINTGVAWAWLTNRSAIHRRVGAHVNSARKINAQIAQEIVRLFDGKNAQELAARFKIRPQTIRDVVNGATWSHATGVTK